MGTQLERLDETLGQLLELAPLLERMALPAELASAAAATFAAGGLQGEQEGSVAALPGWPFGQPAHDRTLSAVPGAKSTGRWPGSRLLQAVWSWRRSRMGVGLGLATLLLVLVLSGTVALLHGLSATHLGPASGAQAVATDTHGRGVTPSPARTATAAAPTQVPGPPTAALAVSPGNVVLPCGGAAVTLAVENTGQQTLNWQASVSGNAALSVTTGSVGAGSKATVSVHATATQHGPGDIVFTSNGGTVKVTFKVSCH